MSGVFVSQLIAELGYTGTAATYLSSLIAEVGYSPVEPGKIEVHATQLSTGSSGLDLEALRLHMERDQFVTMQDTPDDMTGNAGKMVIVNDSEDALIFSDGPFRPRVGEAVPFSSPTGQFWKIPEGSFVTGSLMVAINGEVKIPGADYLEQFGPSGTFELLASPITGSRIVAYWGVDS